MHTVLCPSLTDPKNGVMTCLLGDDGVLSYKDTCNFKCNSHFEQRGSETRTCQSDESWNGTETMCTRSKQCSMCACLLLFIIIIVLLVL